MADVLVIGPNAREHALAWKLEQSPAVNKVYLAVGNGGAKGNIENVDIAVDDVDGLLNFAKEKNIALTVIGPEAAAAAGVADAFQAADRTIFGPTKAAAQIETSKAFSKDLMASEDIPTAEYKNFTNPADALEYAKLRPLPVVLKADGLAGCKGLLICSTSQEVEAGINELMVNKEFGSAGDKVVVEDFLKGQEASFHALTDGTTSVIFPSSQDHKQVNDGDQGPNTGGMGVIAPVDWVSDELLDKVNQEVVQPALNGLQKQGAEFKGCLYPGLMIAGEVIKVLEYNARFGDPECEVYMRLFDGDLYEVLKSCAEGNLDPSSVKWQKGYAVSIVMAAPGYPGSYPKDKAITGIEEAEAQPDIVVFHAGTTLKDGKLVTNGGRVLNVTATGPTLNEALDKAYAAVKLIRFEDGQHYRTDIGRRPA
jgi:phosphoribosylamine--glycine ligase